MRKITHSRKQNTSFRSEFEKKVATFLSKNNIPFKYEMTNLHYMKQHSYKVDFELPNGIIIESKGYFKATDRQKHLEVKKANPDLDIRFLFMNDNKIHKLSDTRYSDWCKKHGFIFAFSRDGSIPLEWLKEKPKKESNVSQNKKAKVKS